MAKRTTIKGYSVICFIEARDDNAEHALIRATDIANALAETYRRGLFANGKRPDIEVVTRDVCSHCGAKWTATGTLNNQCCAADWAEYEARFTARDKAWAERKHDANE